MNNAVHWQAVEDVLGPSPVDVRAPLTAELDYRDPIDLSDRVELATHVSNGEIVVGFEVGGAVRAVARVGAAR